MKLGRILTTGLIGCVTITGAIAYYQYRKAMDWTLSFVSLKVLAVSKSLIEFNLYLKYFNPSALKIEIIDQEYMVYLNESFISRASNKASLTLPPNSKTDVGVNVKIDTINLLNTLKTNWVDLLRKPGENKIRVDIKLRLKVLFYKFDVPYTATYTLAELYNEYVKPNLPKNTGNTTLK